MHSESDEPIMIGPGAVDSTRSWLGEVVPPGTDAPPEEWAEFSDRLTWATRAIARG